MDDKIVKEALSYSLGSDLHDAWCYQELYSFFLRAQKEYSETQNLGEALRQACFKGEQKRLEVELDTGWLLGHESIASRCLSEFDVFKALFDKGVIDVKRYVKRDLTQDEIDRMGSDYIDGKENILRDFSKLSVASQDDNLQAARVVIDLVYDKKINHELITEEEREQMGSFVHEEWLKRNSWVYDPNNGRPDLAVPYEKLIKEERDKDKVQIEQAEEKIQTYMDGLIDIQALCEQYGINSVGRTL